MSFLAMYAKPESGIDVGRLLRKAMATTDMKPKTAAIWIAGPAYESTLSRGINGQGPLDAHGIAMLPLKVVFKFCRLLIAAKLKQWEYEATVDQQRRA